MAQLTLGELVAILLKRDEDKEKRIVQLEADLKKLV